MFSILTLQTGPRDMESHTSHGKEPEPVCKVEWYQLDIIGLTSMQTAGCGTIVGFSPFQE